MIRRIFLLLLLIGGSNKVISQIEIMNDFDLGEYNVGFKHEIIRDFSRSYGKVFRPIQLFIWYPSEEETQKPIYYTDYFVLDGTGIDQYAKNPEGKNDYLDSLLRVEIESKNIDGKPEDVFSKYKNLITIAQKDLLISDGSFPLLLFAPGGNTKGYIHSAICEYLASHGNIVVSLPSLGNIDKQRWPFDQIGLNLQIDDMAFAINHLAQSMKQINVTKIGLISWSVGGVSQAIYSMKNQGIDLFISLDSGIGRSYGIEMLKASPYFDYKKVNIPYLHFTGQQPEQYNVERSSEFYDSIPSQVKYSLFIEPFAHQHFASQIGLIPALVSENANTSVAKAYAHMSLLTFTFIDAYLKDSTDAKKQWEELYKK